MTLERTIDALVVGAGPVGLTAALTLVRDGHRRVEIIDEAERRTGLSYALALHPAALDGLAELGVGAELMARGNRVDRVALYDGAVRRAELDLGRLERAHPFVLVVPQSELEQVLLAALKDSGVEVRWRHRLSRLDAGGDGPVACSIDRIDSDSSGYAVAHTGGVVGKSFDREIPLVIGADGHGSLVRRQLGIEREAAGPSGTVAVFELDGESLPADLPGDGARRELRITFAGGLRSVWWPLPGERTRLGFELPEDEDPTAARGKSRLPSIVPWLASTLDDGKLHELAAERLPWHPEPTGRLMWSVAVRFERALAASFGCGRVWLAGDAAHLAFPFGVQSMNEGILEARELAARCGRILTGTEPLSSLEEYGSARLARWKALLAPAGPKGEIVEALPVAADEAEQLLAGIDSGG
ncbi:MAG TPA: FAD-dependent monooxygenase [Thermoanaerobaculia bacterium]|nr:FAD-dependent monooxygenase [Thermoanaerobaculia bacterium]